MRPNNRGGRRDGAGRKPLEDGRVNRTFALMPRHINLIERYRQQHQLASNSAALRHLIDACAT